MSGGFVLSDEFLEAVRAAARAAFEQSAEVFALSVVGRLPVEAEEVDRERVLAIASAAFLEAAVSGGPVSVGRRFGSCAGGGVQVRR